MSICYECQMQVVDYNEHKRIYHADPILDRLLADDPPEVRNDPAYREHMKGTIAYQATVLSEQVHRLVEDGIEASPRLLRPALRGWQQLYQRVVRWLSGETTT